MTIDMRQLEHGIARSRVVLAVAALLVVYIDPETPLLSRYVPFVSGPFTMDVRLLVAMAAYLVYAAGVQVALRRDWSSPAAIGARTMWVDVLFAVETLMDAIRTVAAGEVWLPPTLQTELAAQLRRPAAGVLSPREEDVLREVALGLRNAEVAARLSISEETVKTHLNRIFRKLGVRDRVGLALHSARAAAPARSRK